MHIEKRTLRTFSVAPEKAEREESAEFRAAKRRLKEDGHFCCFICGKTDDLQVHHLIYYMFANLVDFEKLKEFCEQVDIYGYGRLLKHVPITTIDDIRNMMVLCQDHHTGTSDEIGGSTGIHNLPLGEFMMQKLARPGCNPIPQDGESFEEAMERVRQHQKREEQAANE
ncbi:HNH endonuclease [Paenibacillus ehimensis]|uniref:HNH endonuclease n=1 Tax=Paenibacillus ehimensis TaxID=79264 RepID=A0ABT8VI39_9BACL|nr:HNH endonuclease [Paenibacillus ehimensis]MDO3680651.1 HNH endonuclease [Paenibacillus ehimensis]